MPRLAELFGAAPARLADTICARHGADSEPEILDVGAGSGVWSLAIAEKLPRARVIGFDLPGVTDRFRARADDLGLGDRIDTMEGSYHQLEVGERRFDLALLANVVHLEPPEAVAGMIARAAGCLVDGGELIIVDSLSDGSRLEERQTAAYDLHLALRLPHGQVYAEQTLRSYLADAGLRRIDRLGLGQPRAMAALIASR